LLVRLALANSREGALAAHVLGAVVSARTQHLRDVPAVPGLEGLADLIILAVGNRLVEFRHRGPRPRPAEVPAGWIGARILGGRRGDTSEILAFHDAI